MVSFATELAVRGIDVVTFDFLYAERGRRLPDRNDKLEACYAAVIEAVRGHDKLAGNNLAIGGKSMGGRIASQVAARGVRDLVGLVLLGYPLHPPGKPDQLRAKHLFAIATPMLFVQGVRDAFGTPAELQPLIANLTAPARLHVVDGGYHSFKVAKSAGVSQRDAAIQDESHAGCARPCALTGFRSIALDGCYLRRFRRMRHAPRAERKHAE
jgi:predicted alpha/beta-hydrolase family hydrolase